jgi:hypothetical protein
MTQIMAHHHIENAVPWCFLLELSCRYVEISSSLIYSLAKINICSLAFTCFPNKTVMVHIIKCVFSLTLSFSFFTTVLMIMIKAQWTPRRSKNKK